LVKAPDSVSSVAGEPSPHELRLYTERLCLRMPAAEDADDLYDLFADAEVMQGLGKEPVSAVEEVRAMIEGMISGWRTDGHGAFILETAATNRQVVEQAGLRSSTDATGRPRLGQRQEVMLSPSSAGP
jgi:RimJ/RimL family protein N-acetyltransferase